MTQSPWFLKTPKVLQPPFLHWSFEVVGAGASCTTMSPVVIKPMKVSGTGEQSAGVLGSSATIPNRSSPTLSSVTVTLNRAPGGVVSNTNVAVSPLTERHSMALPANVWPTTVLVLWTRSSSPRPESATSSTGSEKSSGDSVGRLAQGMEVGDSRWLAAHFAGHGFVDRTAPELAREAGPEAGAMVMH